MLLRVRNGCANTHDIREQDLNCNTELIAKRGREIREYSPAYRFMDSLAKVANLRYPKGTKARLHPRTRGGWKDGVKFGQQV
jgi:hypothetical protein